MATLTPGPCVDGHPELALLVEATTFTDRLPRMACLRCNSTMSFEDAVRNDERLRIFRALEDVYLDEFSIDPWHEQVRRELLASIQRRP